MNEDTLKVFVEGATHYFKQLRLNEVSVNTPYLEKNSQPFSSDYTGVIGISGNHKGVVYFTSSIGLIKQALMLMGETDHSEAHMIDFVGEVANTISGNARTKFGDKFDISIPVVLKGSPQSIHLPPNDNSFVIPIEWLEYKAAVVVCIRKPIKSAQN